MQVYFVLEQFSTFMFYFNASCFVPFGFYHRFDLFCLLKPFLSDLTITFYIKLCHEKVHNRQGCETNKPTTKNVFIADGPFHIKMQQHLCISLWR